MAISQGPRVDIAQRPKCGPKEKKNQNLVFWKNNWHWQDLNASLLDGSPVPNQLDHKNSLSSAGFILAYIIILAIIENS